MNPVTIPLNITNKLFLPHTPAYDDTKFGYKRFSSLENAVQTNLNYNFEYLLWPLRWTQQSSIFIGHLLMMIYHQNN